MSRRPGALRSLANGGLAAWLLATLVASPPWLPAAHAAPKGEKVVKGEATFARDGDVTVIRTGKRAIIEYTGFDILSNETVRFEQPGKNSRVLNRVSGDATRIDGRLQANGIVYIVNPTGVFFGRTAIVDVRRLVAAAGDLPDRKFLKQVDQFSLTGPLENHGAIEARSVALLGRSVANHGSIVAPKGVIALVAGERVVLTQIEGGISVEVEGPRAGAERGVDQSGVVDAAGGQALFAVGDHYSLALNHAGVTRAQNIALEGGDGGLVKVSGALDASAPAAGRKGGSVRVTGELVQLEGAQLDASGAAGGGEIRVGGDLRGQGPMRNARRTFVDADSSLRADALAQGDGGSAVVFAEEAVGHLGQISARGGAAGGDGGFAELSSNGALVDAGHADLGAPAGKAGTLLYDPRDIEIVGGTPVTGDGSDTPDTSPNALAQATAGQILFADVGEGGADPFLIYESEIEGTDANIVLEARNSITTTGTFDHAAASEGAGAVLIRSGNDLTMRTRNEAGDDTGSAEAPGIDLTGSTHGTALEFRTSGDGKITLETGTGTADGPAAAIHAGVLRTQGGNVTLTTEDGSIGVGSVDTSGTDGDTGGNAGEIFIGSGDKDKSDDNTMLVTGDLTARGGVGATGAGGNGGAIRVGTLFAAELDGGGDATVMGDIVASGGNGPAGGGNGGLVLVVANGVADVSAGDITSRGGNAQDTGVRGSGGRGGTVTLRAASGDIAVGAVDTRGGNTDGTDTEVVDGETVPREFGGRGGDIAMTTAVDKGGVGGISLNGNLDLRGGDNPNPAFLENEGDGAGGTAELRAKDAIEHAGQAGPHITTQGNVIFNAADVGAVAPIVVSGGDTKQGLLGLGADDIARVEIQDPNTFDDMQVIAFGTTADIQIVEDGDQVVRIQNSELVEADSSQNHADMTLGLQDRLAGADDLPDPLVFTLRTGSIHAGGNIRVTSEDDIRVGDAAGTVATMNALEPDPDADPGDPIRSGALILWADYDGGGGVNGVGDGVNGNGNGVGRVIDGVAGAATGALDLKGDAEEAGGLLVRSRQGIGTIDDPIGIVFGGPIALLTSDPKANTDGGGIFVRNDGGGDLTTAALSPPGVFPVTGVEVQGGPGDIVLENTAGDVRLEEVVRTRGDATGMGGVGGQDGTITLRTGPGGAVALARPVQRAVDAGGNVTFDGPVHLVQHSTVVSRGGNVDFNSSIDTAPESGDRARSLAVAAREISTANPLPGKIFLGGDIGTTNDVRTVVFGGDVVLEGGTRTIRATNTIGFLGDVDADAADSASLALEAGPRVEFVGGDVGANQRLLGFSIARNDNPLFEAQPDPLVIFASDGDQQVLTGAGGISFMPLDEVPDRAMVGKLGGGLTLRSTGGDVLFGQNQKLTVQGDAVIAGDDVQIGDVSALTIDVQAANEARVLARVPGSVLLQSGGNVRDEGTDLVANEIAFSGAAPTIVGAGTVRTMTPDGLATNAGALQPFALQRSISAEDMLRGATLLDLTALGTDLPNEVPQQGPEIDGLAPLRPSDAQASGSALPPGAEETLAYLRCAAEDPHGSCDLVAASPLDSPRGAGLAADAPQFLGDSPEAVARREALARLQPGALRELAVFLTEIRLLGLSEPEYQAVRDSLFGEILKGQPAAPDAGALAKAVQGQSRGVPL